MLLGLLLDGILLSVLLLLVHQVGWVRRILTKVVLSICLCSVVIRVDLLGVLLRLLLNLLLLLRLSLLLRLLLLWLRHLLLHLLLLLGRVRQLVA